MTAESAPVLTSVIMAVNGFEPALDAALSAVLAQTAPIELIVVGSDLAPETQSRLAKVAAEHPRISLITPKESLRPGQAYNLGARAAKGETLLFLKPSSLLPQDAISRLHQHKSHLARPFLIGAHLVNSKGRERPESRRATVTPLAVLLDALLLAPFFPKWRLNLHHDPLPKTIAPVPVISLAFMFVTAGDFWRIKGFDESYGAFVEDIDFCLRFHRAEGGIFFTPDITVTIAGSSSERLSPHDEKLRVRSLIRYFHENFGHAYPQPILWLVDAVIWARLNIAFLRHTA